MNNNQIYQVTYIIRQYLPVGDYQILPEIKINQLFDCSSFAEAEEFFYKVLEVEDVEDPNFKDRFYKQILEIKCLGVINN